MFMCYLSTSKTARTELFFVNVRSTLNPKKTKDTHMYSCAEQAVKNMVNKMFITCPGDEKAGRTVHSIKLLLKIERAESFKND